MTCRFLTGIHFWYLYILWCIHFKKKFSCARRRIFHGPIRIYLRTEQHLHVIIYYITLSAQERKIGFSETTIVPTYNVWNEYEDYWKTTFMSRSMMVSTTVNKQRTRRTTLYVLNIVGRFHVLPLKSFRTHARGEGKGVWTIPFFTCMEVCEFRL